MSTEHILKPHNKTLLLYHAVFPVRYRRKAITKEVARTIKETCLEVQGRYEVWFIEIGTDEDHVHFLIQTVPVTRPSSMVQMIKSITAREIFKKNPEVKKILWGGKFWTSGYYLNTVGKHGNEEIIRNYVQNQGKTYQKIHRNEPTLFDCLN